MRLKVNLVAVTLAAALTACAGPERIVVQAVEAAAANDYDAYAACFTRRSRPILETFWEAARSGNPPVARLGAGDVTIAQVEHLVVRGLGPERAVVTVSEGGQRLRLVVHNLAGAWRIDLLDTERAMIGLSGF